MNHLYFTESTQKVTKLNGAIEESRYLGKFSFNRRSRLHQLINNSEYAKVRILMAAIKMDNELRNFVYIGGRK